MLVAKAKTIVSSRFFQNFIIFIILLNAALIGMETYPGLSGQYGALLHSMDRFCLAVFVIEILLKITACGSKPQNFFKSGWNVFDFLIVAAAFVPGVENQTTVLRLIRLLRVLRLLSALPSMQVMVMALLHSIPRVGQMGILASLLFYIYAVIGTTLFGQHDPQHWGTLHISLLSLFRTLTLEDWTDLMYKGMELYPWAWIYFVSFVLLATFVIFNMLIGIILSSMEEAQATVKRERQKADGGAIAEIKLHEIREALEELETHIANLKSEKTRKQT
ncbi:MAG: ion transporter [Gammaproteobacteria bacterium]|nr:ion transporter [Gammaproteobacteria bacterium]MDH5692128.1 ion transporter [Gammaproteobacteria bacterium]